MKDAVATMGNLLPEDAAGRDAVHVAVFSAVSSVKLFPGQDVGAVSDGEGRDVAVAPLGAPLIGIVDPFLKVPAMPGERFWVYLYPRTITALAHRWSHPAFEGAETTYAPPTAKLESEKWLRDFCDGSDCPSYESVMGKIIDGGSSWDDDYLHFDGHDAHGEIPDEFWKHVEIVLGHRPARTPKYFSCSCLHDPPRRLPRRVRPAPRRRGVFVACVVLMLAVLW